MSKGETEIETEPLRAVTTPYDYDAGWNVPPDVARTLELRIFEHEAVLRFDRVGTATVTVEGQRKPSREIVSVVRTVEVR